MTERIIDGKRVFLEERGHIPDEQEMPILFWGTFFHRENEIEHLLESLDQMIPDKKYVLAAFLAEDWNRDFSPWPAPPAFGEEAFKGGGPAMLHWLKESCLPAVCEEYGKNRPCYLLGYSLAGLFALWAAYETDLFDGVACCSGSLWFKDWDSYVKEHAITHPCMVYLSLGSKEEKTRNQQMALVGDRTRQQAELLKREELITASTLEWNSGGHFADSGKRLAKGMRWLMENADKNSRKVRKQYETQK